jgi:creatinine amidohydrolase
MKKNAKNPFPVMENMTVKMVAAYLRTKQSIIIPIGVIEQHGYHLPLKTDALLATHLGRMLGERTGLLVAPTMYQSFSGGGCPGTINISPATMSLVLGDMLVSLVSQGFRNFYLWLCHGGSENDRALADALKLLLRSNPAFEKVMLALLPVWRFDADGVAWKKALTGNDWHAGWLETSLVMALEPDLVRMEELATDKKEVLESLRRHPDNYQHAQKIVDDALVIPRQRQRPEVKVGVMGFPEKASRELGKKIVTSILKAAVAKINYLEKHADGVYKEVDFTPEPLIFNTGNL